MAVTTGLAYGYVILVWSAGVNVGGFMASIGSVGGSALAAYLVTVQLHMLCGAGN